MLTFEDHLSFAQKKCATANGYLGMFICNKFYLYLWALFWDFMHYSLDVFILLFPIILFVVVIAIVCQIYVNFCKTDEKEHEKDD